MLLVYGICFDNRVKNLQLKNNNIAALTNEWAKYKYLIMEKDYKQYKVVSSLVKTNCTFEEFYYKIDEVLKMPFNKGNFINTAEHVYGYLKNKVDEREKCEFFSQLAEELPSEDKIKKLLKALCIKYEIKYLLASYYFEKIQI